jgi:hypothetical protein
MRVRPVSGLSIGLVIDQVHQQTGAATAIVWL